MTITQNITVEIVMALANEQKQILLEVPLGTTALEAVKQSGLLTPSQISATLSLGIYSKKTTPDTLLKHLDRVEIYRPLIADPKETRRKRAQKTKKEA